MTAQGPTLPLPRPHRRRHPTCTALGAAFALLLGCETLIAGEFAVEISGAAGKVGGTCLTVTGRESTRRDVSGALPLRLQMSGDLISCAVQRKAGSGHLRIVIKDAGGQIVGEGSQAQPFGIVMAAGK